MRPSFGFAKKNQKAGKANDENNLELEAYYCTFARFFKYLRKFPLINFFVFRNSIGSTIASSSPTSGYVSSPLASTASTIASAIKPNVTKEPNVTTPPMNHHTKENNYVNSPIVAKVHDSKPRVPSAASSSSNSSTPVPSSSAPPGPSNALIGGPHGARGASIPTPTSVSAIRASASPGFNNGHAAPRTSSATSNSRPPPFSSPNPSPFRPIQSPGPQTYQNISSPVKPSPTVSLSNPPMKHKLEHSNSTGKLFYITKICQFPNMCLKEVPKLMT